MDKRPQRIECFDNSSLFGQSAVAAMVVFENGQASPPHYRKFNLRSVVKPDDYAAMEEILTRRFANHPEWPLPDLLLVDGGKGQLNIALKVIAEMGMEGAFAVAAIAKKEIARGEIQDKLFIPQRVNPVSFTKSDEALLLLQHIRDEAHRFAISFHRQKRARNTFLSDLDRIPGIGPKRKRVLLRHYGSLGDIRAAALEELSALPGMNQIVAKAVHQHLSTATPSETGPHNPPDPE